MNMTPVATRMASPTGVGCADKAPALVRRCVDAIDQVGECHHLAIDLDLEVAVVRSENAGVHLPRALQWSIAPVRTIGLSGMRYSCSNCSRASPALRSISSLSCMANSLFPERGIHKLGEDADMRLHEHCCAVDVVGAHMLDHAT